MRLASLLLCLLLVPALGTTQEAGAPSTSTRVRVQTSVGSFVIELDRGRAPLTVDAFLKYAKQGFYSGLIFHRVVAGFIAQAGGYTADMQQKPVTASVPNESGNGLSNLRGTVGFARSNDPHSATSQFYVNLGLRRVRQSRRWHGGRRRHRAPPDRTRRAVRSQRPSPADHDRARRSHRRVTVRERAVHLRPTSRCRASGDDSAFYDVHAGRRAQRQ